MINVLSDGIRIRKKRKHDELPEIIDQPKASPEAKKIKNIQTQIEKLNLANEVKLKENNSKEFLMKEINNLKSAISANEIDYEKKKFEKFLKNLKTFIEKNSTNKIRLASPFTENDITIDERFFEKSSIYEFELIFADVLLNTNKVFDILYDTDTPNFINLIYYYYTQRNFFGMLKSLIPHLEASLEKVKLIKKSIMKFF
jgi:hypothetical protein